MKRIRWWWRQGDHYDWFRSYLQVRRTAGMTRAVLVFISASLAVVPLAMLWSSVPPQGVHGFVLTALSVLGGGACALLWIIRWPTKTESITFVIVASASIAMAVLAQSDPTIALIACTAFATISGYTALYHAAPLLVANALLAVLVAVVPAVALTATGGVVLALCAYAVVWIVNVAVPFGIQLLIHTLGVDLLEADRDPLTGLLNRRAFYQRANHLVVAHGHSDSHLAVAMIDLDRFKLLNDSQGHAAGDRALIAVGHALREHARQTAVVGRIGGEEFLVADVYSQPEQATLGQRLCDAVAGLPYAITASVGSASAPCDRIVGHRDPNQVITSLIAAADDAMYDAKRNGGNQSRTIVPFDEYLR